MAQRTCSVSGCEKFAHARGLCPMHYQRWRHHGSVAVPPPAVYAPFRHGTSQGYRYHRCRCDECKTWRRTYIAAYNARRISERSFDHGEEGYNLGCRCGTCRVARADAAAKHYAKNPDGVKLNATRQAEVRRARQRGLAAYKVTERDWRRLCARYDNRCAYCGRAGKLQREHVVPISRGGQHSIGNLLPSCKNCNLMKGRKFLTEWRTMTPIDPKTYYGDEPSPKTFEAQPSTFQWSDVEATQNWDGSFEPGDDGMGLDPQHMPNAAQPGH